MGFIIGLLTAVLVLNSLFLMLLILIQLPKKEAGIGQAFGGAATDALFGAGSGNTLTKITKYSATLFFLMAFGLSIIISHRTHRGDTNFGKALQKQAAVPAPASPVGANNPLQSLASATNLLEAAKTNPAATTVGATNMPSAAEKK
jgi:preprotein translocase subunit SecG